MSNVFSNMNVGADVMVVGQNPGFEEMLSGRPFVGPSGDFLDEALGCAGFSRDDIYLTNVVKCFTHGNRAPTREEMERCSEFLDREFEVVGPKVVLALGAVALKRLTGMGGVEKHCGEEVMSIRYMVPVVVSFHPSPYNSNDPARREAIFEAFVKTAEVLAREVAADG